MDGISDGTKVIVLEIGSVVPIVGTFLRCPF
jgi:hypothetical protein